MNIMNITMYKNSKQYGVFWKRNDAEINYGQTGWLICIKGSWFFTPDGQNQSFAVKRNHVLCGYEELYGAGTEAK